MARKPPQIELREIGGDRFPDLYAAQRAALPGLAMSLAETIRRMIENGALEVVNNQVRPKGVN